MIVWDCTGQKPTPERLAIIRATKLECSNSIVEQSDALSDGIIRMVTYNVMEKVLLCTGI